MTPVNKQSAVVSSKSNSQSANYINGNRVTSMTPLPTRIWYGPREHDLTGRRAGRFTITGCALHTSSDSKNRVRWVARCSCGRYQHLKTQTVKNNSPDNACVECRKNIIRRNKPTNYANTNGN